MREYEPIEDWSPAGRRDLLERERERIITVLEVAFTEYAEVYELGQWGCRGDDPVLDAVLWCERRFAADKSIDPARLDPGSASFRLFTECDWWLAQKVTADGHRARKYFHHGRQQLNEEIAAPGFAAGPDAASVVAIREVERFVERLAQTLRTLYEQTCADLVGFWLEGTASWRARRFGWRDEQVARPTPEASGKARSFRLHDALFRFQCLLHGLLAAPTDGICAVRLSMFCPCDNTPPYRRADRVLVRLPAAPPVLGPRAFGRLRKEGCAQLLALLLERLSSFPGEGAEQLARELGAVSVGKTTLWALGIADHAELLAAVGRLTLPGEDHG